VTTVYVAVVAPGRALVDCDEPSFYGQLVADKARGRGYLVEGPAGQQVGRAASYKAGALLLAEHNGIPRDQVSVQLAREKD